MVFAWNIVKILHKVSLKIAWKLAIKIETVSCPCNTCFWYAVALVVRNASAPPRDIFLTARARAYQKTRIAWERDRFYICTWTSAFSVGGDEKSLVILYTSVYCIQDFMVHLRPVWDYATKFTRWQHLAVWHGAGLALRVLFVFIMYKMIWCDMIWRFGLMVMCRLRQTQLVPRWVTVCGRVNHLDI